ncbi:MAG TPA: DNA primase [Gemmataceae bacterium]|nr:DNA primase [Gemmataceae bacterium]
MKPSTILGRLAGPEHPSFASAPGTGELDRTSAPAGARVSEDRVALTRQVKDASDIVAVVGSYLSLQPAGSGFKAVCPFHNDTRPSLQVDPKWQNFRCWSCGKKGDVFTFVAEFEKITFREARELLARRAGINLEGSPVENVRRGKLLDAMKWAEKTYQECLFENELGERARVYVGQRKLNGPTVRSFGLGFAPSAGEWLVRAANAARLDLTLLHEVGLIGDRKEGAGYYDRFRDRVMFPIRDARGQTVGFGGRILPDSPFADRGPKYYNSSETPLFFKKELLYGLDVARNSGSAEGYLAVVEGYTDVMMAHQVGVTHVVATMGTALNEAHVRQLRRFVPKVVLVFDADAGGVTGVDRALEIFVGCDVELAIATLPEGLDPCDMIAAQGAEAFRQVLAGAVDALDFKLTQLLASAGSSVDGTKRVVDAVLGVMALAPQLPGLGGTVKQELLVTRVAHRLGLRQETVWARFGELRDARKKEGPRTPPERTPATVPEAPAARSKPARQVEKELLQILLAEPVFVRQAYTVVWPADVEHPGLQQLLGGLYRLHEEGETPDIDGLREVVDNPALIDWAIDQQDVGRMAPDRAAWFRDVIERFRSEKVVLRRKQLMDQLRAATDDGVRQRLLREIQDLDRAPAVAAETPAP